MTEPQADGVNDRLLWHPQATSTARAAHPKRVSPGGVHLACHRQQCPGERAQRTGRWRGGVACLAAVRSLTATASAARWRRGSNRSLRPGADMLDRRGTPTTRLRMAGVTVAWSLRVLMVIGARHLRVVGVVFSTALRMAG